MEKKIKPDVGRDSDKFMLRLPDGMRSRIAEAAKANGRSMNAEIVHCLERFFPSHPPAPLLPQKSFSGRNIQELAARMQEAGEAESIANLFEALAKAIKQDPTEQRDLIEETPPEAPHPPKKT